MRIQSMKRATAAITFAVATLTLPAASTAGTYDLTIAETTINVSGRERTALSINGTVPGPTLRFTEGEDLTINVTNALDVDTSLHWHGLIVPFEQDGVPGISFDGIAPGTTHTYKFPLRQAGTYWYHSHSGLQEQRGVYGAIVITPKGREPFKFDRDYVVVLSDWHDTKPERILANLKKKSDYYNFSQRTISDFFRDASRMGFGAAVRERAAWGDMRMNPTDIADVSGYTFLVNGKNPEQNWTAQFAPGERVRLRFVNASAMTYFDVRMPGLKMTVVQADGNNVQPVTVDEFRIAVAETYDVIVRPKENMAYTIFAEPMARTGFARATLAPSADMTAPIPDPRQRPLLTMADMGMVHGNMEKSAMASMADMGKIPMKHKDTPTTQSGGRGRMSGKGRSGMPDKANTGMKGMGQAGMKGMADKGEMPMKGMKHADMAAMAAPGQDPFYAPGSGLAPKAADGGKFLSYADLKAQKPLYPDREATREIEIRLTSNMERYIWSINDVKYTDAEPIRLKYGERVRFKFVNETMMSHPMHLHGMWSILDNGNGEWDPAKHVINVAPGTTVYSETEVDAPGRWAFHCHLMFHMATGMFREVIVEGGPKTAMHVE